MEVSVIIPVYNAEAYIKKAIQSALAQPEVKEILVTNDGSTDQTSLILEKITKKYPKVKILYHPKRKNRGRSASRNLGIKQAKCNYIAFLDADDYYLQDRFANDKLLFEKHPDIDGVYNAIGVHFYRNSKNKEEEDRLKLTTLKKKVSPEELFWYKWPKGDFGNFSGDGLTVKKDIFNRVGLFNEKLKVAEDSELWIRMTLKAKLFPGKLNEAVAIRGVHDANIFVKGNESIYNNAYFKMYKSLFKWSISEGFPENITDFFAEEVNKYFLKNIAIDKKGFLNFKATIIAFSSLLNRGKIKAMFYLIPVLFFYKITGRGYFFRQNLIKYI